MIRKYFCNNSSEEVIGFVMKQPFLSEPLCAAFEKQDWADFPPVPQTYVVLLKDKTLSVKRQLGMMRNLDINNRVAIDSDHLVMLSHPEELARVLNAV